MDKSSALDWALTIASFVIPAVLVGFLYFAPKVKRYGEGNLPTSKGLIGAVLMILAAFAGVLAYKFLA